MSSININPKWINFSAYMINLKITGIRQTEMESGKKKTGRRRGTPASTASWQTRRLSARMMNCHLDMIGMTVREKSNY
ncbi:MAG: hypothetical protein HN590_14805 [Calditrichaeota bacterium]|nr:hypothetical protein [Calditrichota bacterium]MBT7787824.1 hypothetical protein [Calditrichota bacterium]